MQGVESLGNIPCLINLIAGMKRELPIYLVAVRAQPTNTYDQADGVPSLPDTHPPCLRAHGYPAGVSVGL